MATKRKTTPIGRLEIKNYGIIKSINLALDKNLLIIGGGNSQGKTSVLRAIHTCIVGKRAVEGKGSPVRDGEAEGSVFLDLGDLEILRRFDAKDRFEVTMKRDGKAVTSKVQDRLDALCSKMTFDPSFLWDSKVDEKTRAKMLLEAAGVDFSDLEAKRAEFYAERTETGREIARLKGALDKYPLDFDAPDSPVDVSELTEIYHRHITANTERQRALDNIANRNLQYEQFKRELATIRAEIKRLQENEQRILTTGKAHKLQTDALAAEAEAMPQYDPDQYRDQITNAAAHNKAYEAGLQRAEFGKALKEAEREQSDLTREIAAIDHDKQSRLAAAKLPLEGLAATEEGITLHGYPISRASGRDRLTVALSIAFANCDPDFPLVCCDGGEQFDVEWLPHIEKMAQEAGVVLILTRVAKDAQCTVIMQNGEVLTEEGFAELTPVPTLIEEAKYEAVARMMESVPSVTTDFMLGDSINDNVAPSVTQPITIADDFDHDEGELMDTPQEEDL